MRKLSMIVTLCVMSLVGCESVPRPGETPEQASARRQEGLMMMMLGTGMMNQRPAAPPPSAVCHTIKSGVTYQTICQ